MMDFGIKVDVFRKEYIMLLIGRHIRICIEIIRKFVIGSEEKNVKRNYIWNVIAGCLNAAEAVVLSMIVVRVTSLNDAGILTIAFTTANLFTTIGKYGVRSYQITDYGKIPFQIYLRVRYITVLVMIIICVGQSLNGFVFKGYSFYKSGCIFLLCMIFAVESVEDVFWGDLHKNGRLDIGAKMFTIRWSGIILTFLVSIKIIRNLLITLFIAFIVSVFLLSICVIVVRPIIVYGNDAKQERKIFKECLPLCVSNFLNFYICNAPKYAIDKYMNDEVQACFGFVAMPVFVIGLLSSFLYQPMIVSLSEKWHRGEIKEVVKDLQQQIFAIIGITGVCIVGTYLIGVPVLSLIYNTDLNGYKNELILMVSGGGILALIQFGILVLIMMRKQFYIIGCYLIAALLSIFFFPKMAMRHQTCGVAIMYDIIMLILAIELGIIIIKNICNMKTCGK